MPISTRRDGGSRLVQLWVEIVARELAMLVTLVALGIGPASFLGRRFDAAARVAIAPALGLCLSTCVFTTLIWFTAARNTYWLLPLIAAVSVTVAFRRRRTTAVDPKAGSHDSRPALLLLRPRDALALVIVCVVVAAPLSYTLHERNSVGPTSFVIADAVGYTEMADGAVQQSIHQADRHEPTNVNPAQMGWANHARSVENIDAAPLSANLNELLGLGATETQSLFLIVFLVVGALGAFAAVRYTAPKPSWAAPLAGVLFAGPLFLQLMADGSQAAICGIALMLPLAIVGAETLRERRYANLVLLALLASGLMALYPLYVPGVAAAAGAVLLATAILSWLRGRLSRRALGSATARVGVVLTLTIVFNVVSFTRDPSFWYETFLARNLAGKPQYELPISVLPGWLLQTRQFFFLTDLAHASTHQVLIGVILPAIFIVVILIGLWRRRWTLIFVSIVLVFAALAEYASAAHNCSYCVDRNMLPLAPLSIALLALGVAALATMRSRWLRWLGVVVAVAAVIAAGEQTRTERQLFATDSYFLDAGNRALLSDLPPHAGPVDLEGYGQDPHRAVEELALVYTLASERNHGEVSVPNEDVGYGGFRGLGTTDPNNSDLAPNYRYVLTRFGGVRTGRRTIARAGPLALEERTGSLDATVVAGVATPLVRLDTQGLASIVGALHLLVIGGGSAPAWILLRFHTTSPVTAPSRPGVRARSTPNTLTVCVQATGTAPMRRATLELGGSLSPGILPAEPFAEREPPQSVQLVAMYAATHCSPRNAG
jgi:hypothetical protein